MKVSQLFSLYRRSYSVFEGESQDPPATPPAGDAKFTQADVDRIVQERVKREKAAAEKLTSELKDWQQKAKLTEEQQTELSSKIEELENRGKTAEELAKQEQKKLADKYANELKAAKEAESTWKTKYTKTVLERSIIDAAVAEKAVNPSLLVDLLAGNARLGDNDVPFVKIRAVDSESKPTEFDLPISEAVKKMKDMPTLYGTLFATDASGGVGGSNTSGGTGTVDVTKITTEQYMKNRDKIKKQFN